MMCSLYLRSRRGRFLTAGNVYVSKSVMSSARSKAFRLVAIPVAVAAFFSLFLLLLKGLNAGYSALLGVGIWALPNLYFAQKVLTDKIEQSAKCLARLFYRAEVTKLLLSAVLFIAALKFLPVTTIAVLSAYLVAQITFWLTLMIYLGLQTK